MYNGVAIGPLKVKMLPLFFFLTVHALVFEAEARCHFHLLFTFENYLYKRAPVSLLYFYVPLLDKAGSGVGTER